MIGVNNVIQGDSAEKIVENYRDLVDSLCELSPRSVLAIQSLLPVNQDNFKVESPTAARQKTVQWNQMICAVNAEICGLVRENQVIYLDVHSAMLQNGQLNPQLSCDGLHLNGSGYLVWKNCITPLLPPLETHWNTDFSVD